MADECTDIATIHEEMSVFCIYILMGGRWGTRGAFLEIYSPSEKADAESIYFALVQCLNLNLAELLEWF